MAQPAERRIDATSSRAWPIRYVQLCDELNLHGPATATQLAARLGEEVRASDYHLRQLAKYGFVEEDPDRGSGRERWWRRVPMRISMEGHTLAESPATGRHDARAQQGPARQDGAHPGVA